MITLTLLTQPDCGWCTDGKELLDALAEEFPIRIEELDLHSDHGARLAAEHRILFAPGLIAGGKLIAHGRISARALRRELTRLLPTP
jgi:glutaredoxin